jgi:hypothetical protein
LAALTALAAALLHAGPALAIAVYFDGPSGYGISQARADAAAAAGIGQVSPTIFATGSALGISIPDPVVLSYDLEASPTLSNPSTAHSRWTVNHTGPTLPGLWMVFLGPADYTPPGGTLVDYDSAKVGLDISGPDWALVPVNTNGTQYYYPARRLGNLGATAEVDIYHLLASGIVQQGNTLRLPRHRLSFLANIVPEPALLALAGAAMSILFLRRRSLV